ncbi:MAG: sulfatase-like hydrolase/transferase [Deltaproteobacteria bacterium]|nr:sulfatase-like hydrolase/transferase [Deltaproteobacteria bacterium]
MGRHPAFLVAHRVESGDLVLLALGLGLGVPMLLALPALLVGSVSLLAAGALTAAEVLVAAGIYWRHTAARSFATALSPALLLIPALFLFHSPASKLLQPPPQQFEPFTTVAGRSPVVLVIFDALSLFALVDPSDQIDPERYPHLAAFAEDATWFRNASSVAEKTDIAVPAILTGRYPERARLATFSEHRQNLFTLLAGHYQLEVDESVTHLCPKLLCEELELPQPRLQRMSGLARDLGLVYLHHLLPEPLRGPLPPVDQDWKGFGQLGEARDGEDRRGLVADTGWLFDRFLERIGLREERVLHFLHAPVPHPPWKYLPSGRSYGPFPDEEIYYPAGHAKGGWLDDPWLVAQGLQRYLLQVGYVDHLVGRLMARLRETGLYDEALIVVVADHGESFVPGSSSRISTPTTRSDILNVPMLIKRPGQRSAEVVDRNVETIDLLPTIADQLGIDLLEPVDGRSLFGSDKSERAHKLLFRVPIGEEGQGTPNRRFELPAQLPGRVESARRALVAGPFIPARVMGEVRARESDPAPASVAVALNGRIEATVHTFDPEGSGARFAAMLPESAFRQGANELEILILEDAGEAGSEPILVSTRAGPHDFYQIITDREGGAALLLSSTGRLLPILPGAIRGLLVENGLVLGGEARDLQRGDSAETALVFADGRFLSELPFVAAEARDEAEAGSGTTQRPRFRILIPYEHRARAEPPGLRVFALSRGRASELEYRSDFRWRDRGGPAKTTLRLEQDREGTWLAASTGARIALEPEPTRVSESTADGAAAPKYLSLDILSGADGATPLALLVFADGRFALTRAVQRSGVPQVGTEEDAGGPDTAAASYHYAVSIPKTLLQRLDSPRLRFAILSEDGKVREIAQPAAQSRPRHESSKD